MHYEVGPARRLANPQEPTERLDDGGVGEASVEWLAAPVQSLEASSTGHLESLSGQA